MFFYHSHLYITHLFLHTVEPELPKPSKKGSAFAMCSKIAANIFFIYLVSYLFHSDTAEVKEKAIPAQVKKGIHALM